MLKRRKSHDKIESGTKPQLLQWCPLYREHKRDRFKQNSNLERLKPSHKKGVGILTKIESGKMENPHIRN